MDRPGGTLYTSAMVAADEAPLHVPDREELIYLLSEAAELEHGLMCSYLFAAFSLKRDAADHTAEERAAVERWRGSIRAVAVEEMVHLGLVMNLLAAIGAAPHLQRPNLPLSPGFYPPEVVVALRPFDAATLEHFVFLERPAGHEAGDGHPAPRANERPRRPRQLVASAQDYTTVGQLYRGIEAGFTDLAGRLGEARLFVGDPRVQVGPSLLALEGLHEVTDLASARAAIERIIEQGEGARGLAERSHHDRFREILEELRARQRDRPTFEPAHPVVTSPVMNRPLPPARGVHVDAPRAARVLDLANASYGLMVQLLARFFGQPEPDATRRVLGDAAIALMGGAVAPLAELLTTLPASDAAPGRTAGISFALPRSTHALPQRAAAWALLEERAREIADACAGAPPELAPTLGRVARGLRSVAASLAGASGGA